MKPASATTRLATALAGFALAAAAPAPAPGSEAALHWRGLTRIDVDAAHRLLLEDHPGAAPEAGDDAFRSRLAAARSAALERAERVNSYEGYQATLAAFAVAIGDKHIWSRPLYTSNRLSWAGILIARRGDGWVVAAEEEAADGALLKGAALVSCDGVSADRLAEERIGTYRAVWSIEAQRIQRAAWLLVDDGNPFLTAPKSCVFARDGAERTVELRWRPLSGELGPKVAALGLRGAAGFGVRAVGEGRWIAVQSFSEKAVEVVEQVRARAAELRAAPFVVLDLRGNGGGNSLFGRQIAQALYGEAFVEARLGGSGPSGCRKVWRVSERNLKQLAYYRDTLGARMGPEAAEDFRREFETIEAARARGDAFSGPARCDAGPERRASSRGMNPEIRGRVFLLTDNSCFSSCLMVADDFRRLGATHVGEATDANTHYMEVREDRLPSGLSMFSTLQAVSPAMPAQLGPFVPQVAYEGSIADTTALEAWIAGLAAKR